MKILTRLSTVILTVSLIVSLLAVTDNKASASTNPFKDIQGHWAESAIKEGYQDGLVTGFSDGTFRPNDIVTADQFLSMMYRAFNDGTGNFNSSFKQLSSQFSLLHLNILQDSAKELDFDFTNAKNGYWAKPYIDLAYSSYLLDSWNSVFPKSDPDAFKKQLKREGAALLLSEWTSTYEVTYQSEYRNYFLENNGFTDMDNFSLSYETKHKTDAIINGIMNGYPNGNFEPQKYVTRAEAIAMITRLKDYDSRKPTLIKPVGKYYIERSGQYFIFRDKLSHDFYVEATAAMKRAKEGAVFEYYTSSGWFATEDKKEKYLSELYGDFGIPDEVAPDITVITSYLDEIGFTISKETDMKDRTVINLVDEFLRLLSGKSEVNELRKQVENIMSTNKSGSFEYEGIQYYVYNTEKYYEIVKNYEDM